MPPHCQLALGGVGGCWRRGLMNVDGSLASSGTAAFVLAVFEAGREVRRLCRAWPAPLLLLLLLLLPLAAARRCWPSLRSPAIPRMRR
ncbi:hypothetical protein BKA80DRAFT_271050 [Phyllosticta citrichinensis]